MAPFQLSALLGASLEARLRPSSRRSRLASLSFFPGLTWQLHFLPGSTPSGATDDVTRQHDHSQTSLHMLSPPLGSTATGFPASSSLAALKFSQSNACNQPTSSGQANSISIPNAATGATSNPIRFDLI